jgi:hypothetical protein
VDRDDGLIVYRPPSYDDLCKILDIDGAIARAAAVKPERSFWWKMKNYDLWCEEEAKLSCIDEWPDGHFINIDEQNFLAVEVFDPECDIPF